MEFSVLCLTGGVSALLMFPISKVVVDLSFGSKEDVRHCLCLGLPLRCCSWTLPLSLHCLQVDAVLDFGHSTQPILRSKAAKWVHWFMILGLCYCIGVSVSAPRPFL